MLATSLIGSGMLMAAGGLSLRKYDCGDGNSPSSRQFNWPPYAKIDEIQLKFTRVYNFAADSIKDHLFKTAACQKDVDPAIIIALKRKCDDNNIKFSVKHRNQEVVFPAQLVELLAKCIEIYSKHQDIIDARLDRHAPLMRKLMKDNIDISLNLDKHSVAVLPLILDLLIKCVDVYNEHDKDIDKTLGRIVPLLEEILDVCVDIYENHWHDIHAEIKSLETMMLDIDEKLYELDSAEYIYRLNMSLESYLIGLMMLSVALIYFNG